MDPLVFYFLSIWCYLHQPHDNWHADCGNEKKLNQLQNGNMFYSLKQQTNPIKHTLIHSYNWLAFHAFKMWRKKKHWTTTVIQCFWHECLFLIHSTTLSRICMKLVVVMGTTWVADILSWAHSLWYDDLYYVWIITDLINTLQGVFIWLVVGCQPQVRNWY